jgi:hypothetical protein
MLKRICHGADLSSIHTFISELTRTGALLISLFWAHISADVLTDRGYPSEPIKA